MNEVNENLKGDLGVQFIALCAKLLRDGCDSSPIFREEVDRRASNTRVKIEFEVICKSSFSICDT